MSIPLVLEDENGGVGVYSASLRKHYILANDEWKDNIMPEIMDGHNVYDFIDPDILQRLEKLEREEGIRQEQEANDDFEMDGAELTAEEQEALAEIRKKKSFLIQQHRMKKSTAESRPIVPRKFDKERQFTSERMGRQLSSLGLDPSLAINRAHSKSRDNDQPSKKLRLRSRSRSRSRPPNEVALGEGFKDSAQKVKVVKLAKKSVKKRNKDARRGEVDRVIPSLKPKHLFSGKRSIGKTQRH
ncbi:unnamed protein product [Coffea canephora]|uniref:DH200=94 genomic scaffold, scaffold_156 n=1 Tax=Coffea canephora TaxID=49390 RepID=A0A068VA19_COFCA|nr:unnamed protein product [Coffea canephora]